MFDKITKTYLKNFQSLVIQTLDVGSNSVELATRPIVHDYFTKVIELAKPESISLKIHHDIHYTLGNKPDWRVEDSKNFGVYFFGDHKDLSLTKSFSLKLNEKQQIKRYLSFGQPVIVFDGIEFTIYRKSIEDFIKYSIIEKPLTLAEDWSIKPINDDILDVFSKLFKDSGFRKWSELTLIKKLATKAHEIADIIETLLSMPKKSGENSNENLLIEQLHQIYTNLKDTHDSALENQRICANFISQVLTFGLFYAHTRQILDTNMPEQRRKAIEEFWGNDFTRNSGVLLRPFKIILNYCEISLNTSNVLSSWYKDVLNILAHAEYMGNETQPSDYHALFEGFFKIFDPKQRFDSGTFYTPPDLGNWMVEAAKAYIDTEYSNNLIEVIDKVIDPCCGTGGLLESFLRIMPTTPCEKQIKIIGFEILPAPYALANYRLKNINKNFNKYEVEIFLTDTLSDMLVNVPILDNRNGLINELIEANKAAQPPIQLIITNPPSANDIEYKKHRIAISNLMEDFKPPIEERKNRQNTQKALENDAYRFLRWCSEISLQSEKSIMILVMPGTLSYSTSFKYLRKWLLDKFHDILVLQVDEDARTNIATQSLFAVKQGRLVIMAVRDAQRLERIKNEILFHDISSKTKSEKIKFLQNFTLEPFETLKCEYPNYLFSKTDNYPKELWNTCIPLAETKNHKIALFKNKCSGLKLAPTALLVHTDQYILKKRSLAIAGKGPTSNQSNEDIINIWFKGQRVPPKANKLTPDVKKNLGIAPITRYSFRPFLTGYLSNSSDLFDALSKTPGGGTRSRPEIRFAFENKALGISLSPAPMDLGSELTRISSFVWYIPDNDLVARGNAMIYCDKFPSKGKSKDQYILIKNIIDKIQGYFKDSHEVLFYTYAILSSNTYLNTFKGILFKSADPNNPIRIPILKDKLIRDKVAELGNKIANCENIEFINKITDYGNLSIITDNIGTGFRLGKITKENNRLELWDETKLCLSIEVMNSTILELEISGHNVVDKWLREKTYAYYKKEFENETLIELKQLLVAIATQLELLKQVDAILIENFEMDDFISFAS